jgi:protein required for attachment to host cells
MILVVNANSSLCRFYDYQRHPAKLTLLKEIQHPENKLKNSELTSDKSGHYQSSHTSRGAYSPHRDAKEIHINNFSREVANMLDKDRNSRLFDKLILIAPSHLNGLLLQHLNKHVIALMTNNIQKDLFHLREDELITYLQNHAEFPDPA